MAADPRLDQAPAGPPEGPAVDADGPPGEIEVMAAGADFDALLDASAGGPSPGGVRRWSALGVILWVLGLVPVAALALLLSMAVRVRLVDGRWPTRNQPDPKDLGFHNTITVLVTLASFVVVLVVPVLALVASLAGHRGRIPVKPPVVAVAGLAALMVVLVGDIGGLGTWIGD